MTVTKSFALRCATFLIILPAGITIAADAPATPPNTKYTCGVFVQRYVFTQYVTLRADGTYESSTGATGKFHYDAGSKRILFDTGKFQALFGSYEPKDYPMFRLSSREDAAKSDYTRAWRSQVCSGK
jgi:hypothetical protein